MQRTRDLRLTTARPLHDQRADLPKISLTFRRYSEDQENRCKRALQSARNAASSLPRRTCVSAPFGQEMQEGHAKAQTRATANARFKFYTKQSKAKRAKAQTQHGPHKRQEPRPTSEATSMGSVPLAGHSAGRTAGKGVGGVLSGPNSRTEARTEQRGRGARAAKSTF